ncbi:vascular endothelial zinc finger 1 [Discoglossus pictus]
MLPGRYICFMDIYGTDEIVPTEVTSPVSAIKRLMIQTAAVLQPYTVGWDRLLDRLPQSPYKEETDARRQRDLELATPRIDPTAFPHWALSMRGRAGEQIKMDVGHVGKTLPQVGRRNIGSRGPSIIKTQDIQHNRPDHLSCHVKHVHSTERPFKCQTCTAAFATKDRLRTHMVRHEGKVSCNICGKLLSAAYITSHLKTHGQSQGINCNTCKQGQLHELQSPVHCRIKYEAPDSLFCAVDQNHRTFSIDTTNMCQTSTAAQTPVTLTSPFNITSSMAASGTLTNPVTVAAAMSMSMRSPVNVSSPVNITSPMNLGHPVTITTPISMTSPLSLTSPVNLPTSVTAPVNIAHPVTITSPMNLPTPMTLAGPLNIAMRPVESMPFLSQALPSSPPW